MRKHLKKLRDKTRRLFHAQGAFEYVLLLGGVILIVILSVTILRSGVLGSANAQLQQGTGNFTQVVDYGAAISGFNQPIAGLNQPLSTITPLPPDFTPPPIPVGENDVFEIVSG